jgi:hypothetical protein
MNHLEQLVGEWLQYQGYFVRVAVPVGPRAKGGFDGELDVIGLNFAHQHLLHVECSLDADSWHKRREKVSKKFERGRKHIKHIFRDVPLPEVLDQVCILKFASSSRKEIGGGRILSVHDFVHEIFDGLKHTSPASGAVPSTYPLLRTLQLATNVGESSVTGGLLVPTRLKSN